MRIGKLRHRVTVTRNCITQDDETGEMVANWEPVCNTWAEIVPLSARDLIAANAAQSEVRGRIVMRHRDDVSAGMRVEHDCRYYNILGVMADPRSMQEYLTLMVSEGVRLDQ